MTKETAILAAVMGKIGTYHAAAFMLGLELAERIEKHFAGHPPERHETDRAVKISPEVCGPMALGACWFITLPIRGAPYQIGDVLTLCEFNEHDSEPTGRTLYRRVTFGKRNAEQTATYSLSL